MPMRPSSPLLVLPDSYWRSLGYFNLYRLVVGAFFIAAPLVFGDVFQSGSWDPRLFRIASIAYAAFALMAMAPIRARRPRFNVQLTAHVCADVSFTVMVMHASGGVESGLGLLLLTSIAAAALISRGRLTLFYAAIASIGVLLQHTWNVLEGASVPAQFVQAGLVSTGYFAIAWLAHMLARYASDAERLARQRGIDLANLSQVSQLVIQEMQDGVLVVDPEGRVRQHNSQAGRLLGVEPVPGDEPLLGALAPVLAEPFARWREDPGANFDLMRIPETSRLVRPRFISVASEGRFGAVIFLEDMSRVQAQAQQLKLAALGRLTANIAHEIRNPLAAISHAAELFAEEDGLGPTQGRLLRIIRDNARRLDRIVQDVLQLNRRDRVHPEPIRPAAFLQSFIEEFCEVEQIPPGCLLLEVREDIPLSFDRGHFNQVLWNLCSNAWRHGKRREGSVQLKVGAGRTPNVVHIEVLDDGPGVPRDSRGQVFEPFFTTSSGGTGLGLFIAREICDANGATLELLDSEGGAHFRILCRGGHVKAQRASDAMGQW